MAVDERFAKIVAIIFSAISIAIIGVALNFVARVEDIPRGCCCTVFPEQACRVSGDDYLLTTNCTSVTSSLIYQGVCTDCNPKGTLRNCFNHTCNIQEFAYLFGANTACTFYPNNCPSGYLRREQDCWSGYTKFYHGNNK
eukprot:TRINITY_DN912_c0_g1_i1.p1 TRINITY_DN912_c0_g1~~TRINITY_DN912_c0_g1_i1.p1  ORF type:complete len:140 (-),score=14.54 TRINITY_DN912_c0_g1_i1:51-470(-)